MKAFVKTVKWVFAIILMVVVVGGIIIWVTPMLYPLHPLVQEKIINEDAKCTINVQDTIYAINDSTIVHSAVIKNKTPDNESSIPTIGDLGTFGDSAGFWNAIFSALAFGAVILTFRHQHKKDQEDDERARLAQFQGQCMTMMSMLAEIVSQLRISENDEPSIEIVSTSLISNGWSNTPLGEEKTNREHVKREDVVGRACFKYIYNQRPGKKSICGYIAGTYKEDACPNVDVYAGIRKVMENHFDHYFRTLYRILKFIKESDLGRCDIKKQEETRDLCADLVRAQLSTFELAVLYYNGLYPEFNQTAKLLYEHFCLFDNMDPRILQLKSERDYYSDIRQHHKNDEVKFDSTTHYDFSAFTRERENEKKNRNKWRRITEWCRIFFLKWSKLCCKNKQTLSIETDVLDEDSNRVYQILRRERNKNITNKQLKVMTRLSEGKLKSILNHLRTLGYISWTNGNCGKRYTIYK